MSTPHARDLRTQVELALDRFRPALVADGGNVELVGVDEDGVVQLLFQGTCATCPAQLATLRYGLEPALRKEVPGVETLVPVDPWDATSDGTR